MFNPIEYDSERLLRVSAKHLQGLLVVTANKAGYSGLHIAISSIELERVLHVVGSLSSGLKNSLSMIEAELIKASIESSNQSKDLSYPLKYLVNIDPRTNIKYSDFLHKDINPDLYPIGVVSTAEEFRFKRDRVIEGYFLQYHDQHKKELFQKILETSIPFGGS